MHALQKQLVYIQSCQDSLITDLPITFSHLPEIAKHFAVEQVLSQSDIFNLQNTDLYSNFELSCTESNRRQYTKRAYCVTRRQTQL